VAGRMGRVWALVLFNKIAIEVIIGTKTLYIWVDETVTGILNPYFNQYTIQYFLSLNIQILLLVQLNNPE
jgi:hypothetical protein